MKKDKKSCLRVLTALDHGGMAKSPFDLRVAQPLSFVLNPAVCRSGVRLFQSGALFFVAGISR
jgi:hypothetical protein